MKPLRRVEPTHVHKVGDTYKRTTVVKNFQDKSGAIHEFPTWNDEDNVSCAVIALTTDNKVIVSYQFRPGPEKWMHDLPGGGVEEGENPQAAVIRELEEETGYVPGSIEALGESCRDAYMNGTWHFYLALNCTLMNSGSKPDEEEIAQGMKVQLITIDELIQHAKTGGMTDGIAVLMAYEKLKEIQDGK